MKLENKKGEYLMALVDLTSVTTGSIGTNTNFIVEENKVLKRISQSSLLKTSAISTTQVNSTTNVPSSSLVYSMNQSINKLNSDLYNNLPGYKEIWNGTLNEGESVEIPDILKYRTYAISSNNYPIALWGFRWGVSTTIMCFGADPNPTDTVRVASVFFKFSGNTVTLTKSKIQTIKYGDTFSNMVVNSIYGIT